MKASHRAISADSSLQEHPEVGKTESLSRADVGHLSESEFNMSHRAKEPPLDQK